MGFPKGIQKITSTGATVTITDPNGPTTNLEATGGSFGPLTGDVTAGPGSGSQPATLVATSAVKTIIAAWSAVTSVFGRPGAVTAQKGDYNATQVPNVVVAVTQSATPAIDTDNGTIFEILSLAQAVTSQTTNLTGTPVDGQQMTTVYSDNGTARALAFGAKFIAGAGATLPSTTVVGGYLYIGWMYSSAATAWVFQYANVASGGGGGSSLLTQINGSTSGSISASVGDIVNTTAAATVTLPASPSIGQAVLVNRGNHNALITITANTGQTINGGSSGGSVSMPNAGAVNNSGQALFIAQSATAWHTISANTDLGAGFQFTGGADFEGYVQINNSLGLSPYHTVTIPASTNAYSNYWVRITSNTTGILTLNQQSAGQMYHITNEGTGVVTVTPASGTIDGVTSRVMTGTAHPCGMTVLFDGTNWHTVGAFGAVT